MEEIQKKYGSNIKEIGKKNERNIVGEKQYESNMGVKAIRKQYGSNMKAIWKQNESKRKEYENKIEGVKEKGRQDE